MITKYQMISMLAEDTARQIARNGQEWMKYLDTAARLYKYPFNEQMLIYAQRPDASACASLETWNEKMNCWVNRGAKGIALIDTDSERPRLKYVFDVSDVHKARRIGRDPYLWELKEEHKGQLSHNLEIGSDPLGNISRINHALESMTKGLAEAKTKLDTVEHQLETAKVEVQKPFAQEQELSEKLDRLSALNALLNMEEKGNDAVGMEDDEPEMPEGGREAADCPAGNIPLAEKLADAGQGKGISKYADAPAARVSLKEKLEAMKVRVAGGDAEKTMPQKVKGREETL